MIASCLQLPIKNIVGPRLCFSLVPVTTFILRLPLWHGLRPGLSIVITSTGLKHAKYCFLIHNLIINHTYNEPPNRSSRPCSAWFRGTAGARHRALHCSSRCLPSSTSHTDPESRHTPRSHSNIRSQDTKQYNTKHVSTPTNQPARSERLTNERTNERLNERTKERTNEGTNE